MSLLIATLLLLYLLLTRGRGYRTRPDRLLAIFWAALLGGYHLLARDFVPLTLGFAALFLSFFAAFCIGHVIGERTASDTHREWTWHVSPRRALVGCLLVGVVPFVLALNTVRAEGLAGLMDLRMLLLGDSDGGRQSIGLGFAFPIACGGWYTARRIGDRRWTWVLGLLVLMLAILSTSKIFLVLFLIFLVPSWSPALRPRRWAVGLAVLGCAAFAALHLVLGKLSSSPDEGGVLRAVGDTFRVYLFGGVAAFQQVLRGVTDLPRGMMWKSIGDLFPGVVEVPADTILPWTDAGEWFTNVYTAFAYWWDGLGALAGVTMGLLLGLLYGNIFATRRDSPHVAFYRTFLLFPLLFLFHQDFYLSALGMHIGFGAIAFAISFLELPEERAPWATTQSRQ